MKNAFRFGAIALFLTASSPAFAAIQIFNAPGVVQPAENVLLPSGQTGTTVMGMTNQSATSVTFKSNNGDVLTTPSNGQARIETTENPSSLAALQFYLTNPSLNFTQFEFNLANIVGNGLQLVTLNYAGSSSGSSTFSLGNGSNWLAGNATDGSYFTNISFAASGAGTNDIRQIRIGGISATAAVPEPATWMLMFMGLAFIGTVMRRKQAAQPGARVSFA